MKLLLSLLILLNFPILHAGELEEFVKKVQEAKPDIKRVREAYKEEQRELSKDPFNNLEYSEEQMNMLSAKVLLGELNNQDEDYMLKMYRGDDPVNGIYNYPAIDAPAIMNLTAQVNDVLQKVSNAPQVYELEAMYVLYKDQINSQNKKCTRENLGVTDYTQKYSYDPKAMILLSSYNTSLSSVQIMNQAGRERIFYYRGVLNNKKIIVQIYIPGNGDEAQVKVFTMTPLPKKPTQEQIELAKKKQREKEEAEKKKNKWGKLYGGEYKGENGSIKGGFGFEYEHDDHMLPKNITIWQLEGQYNTEDLVLSVSSKLDTKDQIISTKMANKDNENNSLELFLKGENPGIKVNNEFFAGEYKFKGATQLYKKELSGTYSFSGPDPIFSLSTSFKINQEEHTERYEVSKDLYRHANDYESTVVNLKFRQDRGAALDEANDTVWLTLSRKF